MVELTENKEHMIIKRDGRKEKFNPEKLLKVTNWATNNYDEITKQLLDDINIRISDEMRIQDLYDELIKVAVNKISAVTPMYDDIAKRLYLMKLYKETYQLKRTGSYPHLRLFLIRGLTQNIYYKSDLLNCIEIEKDKYELNGIINEKIVDKLNEFIEPDRDLLFNYKGLRMFFDKYCKKIPGSKTVNGTVELPQTTFIVAAMQSFVNILLESTDEEHVEKFCKAVKKQYDLLSTFKITYSTPNISMNFKKNNQFASCVLITADDNTESLNDADAAAAQFSKNMGGIAYDASFIRARGSTIVSNSGKSDGPVPFIKRLEQTVSSFNQQGCLSANSYVLKIVEDKRDDKTIKYPIIVPIKSIQVGDYVLSYDVNKQEAIPCKVLETHSFNIPVEQQYKLSFDNGSTLITSDHHPIFYIDENKEIKYKRTDEMKLNDKCINANNANVFVTDIERPNEPEDFYDLTVENCNNYFAATTFNKKDPDFKFNFVLVHNTRSGSCVVYFPWWHLDVLDMLMLKDAGGSEEMRARKNKYGLKINRLLFERYKNNDYITLFDPKEVPLLNQTYGEEFEKAYRHYEKDGSLLSRRILAKDLLFLFIKVRAETGNIYAFFSENVNEQNMTNKYISMSNLCCFSGNEKALIKENDIIKEIELEKLVNQSKTVWNGYEWSEAKFKKYSNNDKLYLITLEKSFKGQKDTIKIRATGNHKWLITFSEDLRAIDNQFEEPVTTLEIKNLLEKLKTMSQDVFLYRTPVLIRKFNLPDSDDQPFIRFIKIEDDDTYGPTYCCEEPVRHTFIINGVLTHNCEITVPSSPSTNYQEIYTIDENNKPHIEIKKDAGEIGLCNLASINSLMWYELNDNDKNELIYNLLSAMDNRLDIQYYPVKEGKLSNLLHRPIGIGITDFANLLATNKLKFTDEETLEFTNKLYDDIYHRIYYTSMILASERGPFKTFKDSKWALGLTPLHLSRFAKENPFNLNYDWEKWNKLAKLISQIGVRFSLHATLPPSATSGKVTNATEACEPIMDLFYIETGTHSLPTVVKGRNFYKYYQKCWDVPNKTINTLAAIRQAYIDQSQSFNHYYKKLESAKEILDDIIHAESLGVKTLYYLKTPKFESETTCSSCSV